MAPRNTSAFVTFATAIVMAFISFVVGVPAAPAENQIIWWGVAGNWNNATHWSPTSVPDAPDEFAWIQGGGGTYTVDLDISPNLFKMQSNDTTVTVRLNGNSISVNPGPFVNEGTLAVNTGISALNGPVANTATGSIEITPGATLALSGPTLVNDGDVRVNISNGAASTLNFSASTTIGGAGSIYLLRPGTESQLTTTAGAVLTQALGHTIHGRGQIHAALVNDGMVSADVSAWTLSLLTNNKTNHNLFQTTGGGDLVITGITVENTGGVIRAGGGDVTLNGGATIHGGTLERTGAGVEYGTGAVTLDNVTHAGLYRIANGTTTTIRGATFNNSGTIDVNYSNGAGTFLTFPDTTVLQGGGTVYLMRPNAESQLTTGPGGLLTQAAGNTIHGRGQIHAALVNEGVVTSDVSASTLTLLTNNKTNHNLFQTTGGGDLAITGITIENTGGVIRAGGGDVNLSGATIRGGTLERTGTGVEYGTGAVTLDNVTHTGLYRIANGTTTTIRGATFNNSGTIDVNYSNGAATFLTFPDTTVLQGGGTVYLMRPNAESQLTTGTSGLLTQAAGNTIHGRGQIHAALVNDGVVSSDLSASTLTLLTNNKTNHNLFQTTGGGDLAITGITVENAGGVIRAGGGDVNLSGTTIRGGILERTGAGVEYATGAVTLENLTHRGYYRIANGTTTTVKGTTFLNDGTIDVNYTSGTATFLTFADSVTLQGTGIIYMMRPNAESQIRTVTPGTLITQSAGHTIHGRGQIHARILNQGTIRADLSASTLTVDSTVTNLGAVEASSSGTMTLSRTPTNWTADSTLTGGAWRATSATLRVTGVIVAKNAAEVLIDGTSSQFYRDAGTTNALTPFRLNDTAGSFTIRNGRDFATIGAFTNRGALRVESATSAFTVLAGQPFLQTSGSTTLGTGGTLVATGGVQVDAGSLGGVGTVQANTLVTGGQVAPGASAGQLNITGTYTQNAGVTLNIELGGTAAGQSDLLNISGAASLDGTLALTTLLATYGPTEGDTITIMRFPSRTGAFSSVTGTNPYPGITLTPVYSDTTVKIVVNGILTTVPGVGTPSDPSAQGETAASSAGDPLPTAVTFTSRVSAGGAGAAFELALPEAADVRIVLYDARGRRIRTLLDAALPAGRRTIDTGAVAIRGSLTSGLYFARAEIRTAGASSVSTARAVIVR